MQDPTVQKIASMAQDENVQKAVKEGFENVAKYGDQVAKGLDQLLNKGNQDSKLGGIFNFMQK